MPTWDEYHQLFGLKELILTIVSLAIIFIAREERRIFRRKK